MKTQQTNQLERMTASNLEVRRTISASELEYHTLIFDAGCRFLEGLYPNNKVVYQQHSRDEMFWKWYRMMVYTFEQNYLQRKTTMNCVNNLPEGFLRTLFVKDFIFFCIESKFIKKSYSNYLNAAENLTQPRYERTHRTRLQAANRHSDKGTAEKARIKTKIAK